MYKIGDKLNIALKHSSSQSKPKKQPTQPTSTESTGNSTGQHGQQRDIAPTRRTNHGIERDADIS